MKTIFLLVLLLISLWGSDLQAQEINKHFEDQLAKHDAEKPKESKGESSKASLDAYFLRGDELNRKAYMTPSLQGLREFELVATTVPLEKQISRKLEMEGIRLNNAQKSFRKPLNSLTRGRLIIKVDMGLLVEESMLGTEFAKPTKSVYEISLEVQQLCQLARHPSFVLNGTTYAITSMASSSDYVERVNDLINAFLADLRSVNASAFEKASEKADEN